MFALGAIICVAACSDDPTGPPSGGLDTGADANVDAAVDAGADPGADAPLDASADELPLAIGEDGRVTLTVDERVVFSMPAGASVDLLSYELRWEGALGIWDFTRRAETSISLDWTTVERVAGVPTLSLEGDGVTGTLTAEPVDDINATRFVLDWEGVDAQSAVVPIPCDEGGSFHGFGEQYNATDQRGEAFELFVNEQGIGREGILRQLQGDSHTTYFPMPYLLDVRGHGLLFETDHRVVVDLCASDPDVASFDVSGTKPLSWVVFHGPTMPDVIEQLGDLIGRPVRPPDWAFELWVSIQGGAQDVLDEVAALEAAEIPLRAVWTQDWTGFRRNLDGGSGVQYRWAVGEDLYPDLAGLVETLKGRGYRFLGYANPFVDANLVDFFPDMAADGLLIRDAEGAPYTFAAPNGQSSHPDFTNPATRQFVEDALVAMVEDYDMDGWMSDFGEWTPLDAVLDSGADPLGYHNRFPVDWHGVVRAALDRARPDGDYVTFARSGWTGVQAHAMIHWIGDQEATWSELDGLPTVVAGMINLGLAGQPFVTHDIGGFSGGPSTKELYQRWVELGAFTPIMRTHEGNRKDANWNWNGGPDGDDPETIAHFRRFTRIHDALRPELEALADEAAETGMPMVRHMMLEFPDDPATHALSNQYMLGPDLLVAPVTERGATERRLYLPEGLWFDVWTGDEHSGPGEVTISAPVGSPPVLSRGADRADLRAF